LDDPPEIMAPQRQFSIFSAIFGDPAAHVVGALAGPEIVPGDRLQYCGARLSFPLKNCFPVFGMMNQLARMIVEAGGRAGGRAGVGQHHVGSPSTSIP
jgi:hypothetical protein